MKRTIVLSVLAIFAIISGASAQVDPAALKNVTAFGLGSNFN